MIKYFARLYNVHLIVGRKTVDNNRNGQGENKDLQIIETRVEICPLYDSLVGT